MAETICPVVDGVKLQGHEGAAFLHVVGATLTAALLGAVVAAVGMILGAPWGTLTMGVVALAAALGLAGTWGLPLQALEGRRQVPEWWRTFFSPRPAAFLYGAALGTGFPFHLRYLTLTCVAVAVAATGDVVAGTIVMGIFGFSRGLVVTPAIRGRRVPDDKGDLWLNRVALAIVLLAALGVLVSA